MLGRYADAADEAVGVLFQFFDDRGHLDGFWAGAEYREDLFHEWVGLGCV